jgi:3-deoxy-7-phosphoheptulonate synthase
VASGADGVHIEVHSCPEKAMSDGSQALLPDQYAGVMEELKQLAALFDKVIPVPQEQGE